MGVPQNMANLCARLACQNSLEALDHSDPEGEPPFWLFLLILLVFGLTVYLALHEWPWR